MTTTPAVSFADYTQMLILNTTCAYEILIMTVHVEAAAGIRVFIISVMVLTKMEFWKKWCYSPALFLKHNDMTLIQHDVNIECHVDETMFQQS